MRLWSSEWVLVAGDKAELYQSIAETDAWIDGNQAAYNSALTYAANYTTAQKTLIFCVVALARVSIAFLRRVLGEVD